MKTKEVLKHLGVTRQNLQYYIKMGKITPVGKEGTSYIFDERQIKGVKTHILSDDPSKRIAPICLPPAPVPKAKAKAKKKQSSAGRKPVAQKRVLD